MPENRGCGCGLFGGDNDCLWIIILLIIFCFNNYINKREDYSSLIYVNRFLISPFTSTVSSNIDTGLTHKPYSPYNA